MEMSLFWPIHVACQALSSGAPKASDDQVLVISQVIWKEASRTMNQVRNMLSFLSRFPLLRDVEEKKKTFFLALLYHRRALPWAQLPVPFPL